jgi:hypothetical protein
VPNTIKKIIKSFISPKPYINKSKNTINYKQSKTLYKLPTRVPQSKVAILRVVENTVLEIRNFVMLLKESFTKMGNWFITLMSLTESEEAQKNTCILVTKFHQEKFIPLEHNIITSISQKCYVKFNW